VLLLVVTELVHWRIKLIAMPHRTLHFVNVTYVFKDCFGASEVTRQTVTGSLRAPPLVKDIETTTLYTQVADGQLDAVQVSILAACSI
jgi:hypothetical protein